MSLKSDNRFISNVAFSSNGYSNDIVIVQNSSGHVVIQTRKGLNIDLVPIVSKLRKKEISKRGGKINKKDYHLVFKEGFVSICPEWFYFKSTQSIFNGSDIYDSVNPTALSLEQIEYIILNELKNSL